MGNETAKKYFRCSVDGSGPKFFCNYGGYHYTLRFAGNPIYLLEHFYAKEGGSQAEFDAVYALQKEGKPLAGYPGALERLKKAASKADEMISALKDIALGGKSPFVMYVSPYDESMIPKGLEADERV